MCKVPLQCLYSVTLVVTEDKIEDEETRGKLIILWITAFWPFQHFVICCYIGERESERESQVSTKHRDGRQAIEYYLCRHNHFAVWGHCQGHWDPSATCWNLLRCVVIMLTFTLMSVVFCGEMQTVMIKHIQGTAFNLGFYVFTLKWHLWFVWQLCLFYMNKHVQVTAPYFGLCLCICGMPFVVCLTVVFLFCCWVKRR